MNSVCFKFPIVRLVLYAHFVFLLHLIWFHSFIKTIGSSVRKDLNQSLKSTFNYKTVRMKVQLMKINSTGISHSIQYSPTTSLPIPLDNLSLPNAGTQPTMSTIYLSLQKLLDLLTFSSSLYFFVTDSVICSLFVLLTTLQLNFPSVFNLSNNSTSTFPSGKEF